MARAVGYFVLPFKRYHGITQGDPLPPKLFNMVVDSIIHHWGAVVAEIEEGPEGLGMLIWDLAAYSYSYNGLVASNQTERLQRAFAILTGLFDRAGLRTNTRKTVNMACQPCHLPVRMLLEVYERWTTGTGPTFWERHRRRVHCPEFRVEITTGLRLMHHQIQHIVGQGDQGRIPQPPLPGGGPNSPGLFTKTFVAAPVPGRGVPGWCFKLDQPPGSL